MVTLKISWAPQRCRRMYIAHTAEQPWELPYSVPQTGHRNGIIHTLQKEREKKENIKQIIQYDWSGVYNLLDVDRRISIIL